MIQILHGVIHGKTIELAEPPQLADGAQVQVVIRPANDQVFVSGDNRDDGIADYWTEEDDWIFEEIARSWLAN